MMRWFLIATPLSLIGSYALFEVLFFLDVRLFGTGHTLKIWLWPGMELASLFDQLMPHELLYGSPESRDYWPAATFVSMKLLLSVASWWALVLGIGLAWRLLKPNAAAQSDALRTALGTPTDGATGHER